MGRVLAARCALAAADDSERLGLTGFFHQAWQLQETDAEQSFAIFTRGRDEARRLNESWWVLFFEHWRLNAMVCYVGDFARALPLGLELMVRFHAPDGQASEWRIWVLMHVFTIYSNIDPLGYQDEIERSLASLDAQIARGSNSERLYLAACSVDYLSSTERWGEAYDVALRSLAMVEQLREPHTRVWHGAWAHYRLCRICLCARANG